MVVRRRTWLGCTRPWQKRPPVELYSHKAPPSYHPKGERDTKSPIKQGDRPGRLGGKTWAMKKPCCFGLNCYGLVLLLLLVFMSFLKEFMCVFLICFCCVCVFSCCWHFFSWVSLFYLALFMMFMLFPYLFISFLLLFMCFLTCFTYFLMRSGLHALHVEKRMIRKGYTSTDRNHAIPNDHTAARNYPSSLLPYAIKMQEASALERMKSPHNPSYWATNLEIQTSGLEIQTSGPFLIKTSNQEVEPHLSSILKFIGWYYMKNSQKR